MKMSSYFPLSLDLSKRSLMAATILSAVFLIPQATSANTLYFGTGTGLWETAGNWYTDAAGTTPSGAAPTSADDLTFNITSLNSGTTAVSLNAAETINSLTFANTLNTTISGTGGNRNLTIGAGGITLNSGAGPVTIGNSGANQNIFVKLGTSQTWTNNSSSLLTIRNNAAGSTSASGPITLTLNCTGVGGIADSGQLNDGNTAVSLVVASTGSGIVSISGGTWNGGTTVKSGALNITALPSGTGAMLLGDTSGTFNSTLSLNYSGTTTTNLTVRAGNTGTATLSLGSATGVYAGAVTLNNDLSLNGTTGATLSGAVSGTAGLIKVGTTTVTLSGSNSYTGVTNLSAGILTISGTNALAGGGNITFTSGTLQYSAGNQVDYASRIKNSTSAVAIDTGGQNVLFSGTIDSSNAAGLTKSGTGTLTLSAANTYGGNTNLSGGTLALGGNSVLSSGTLIVTNGVTLQSDSSTARTLANNIDISTSGTLTIGAGGDLTFGILRPVGGARTIIVNNGVTTFASGANNGAPQTLTKSGTGALVVTGSYQSGGSIIQDGILAVTGSYSSTGNINLQGGILGLSGTFSRNLGTAASQTQFTGNGGFAATGTNSTWGNAANNLTVNLGGGAALAFGGANFLASGQTLLLGSSISNGTVTVRNALDLAGTTQTTLVNRGTSAPSGGVDAILSGTLSNGGFTKTGSGVLALAGANTYTGATTVSAGTLLVGVSGSGSLANTAVTVASGATLGGSGSITGSVTIQDGGSLSPGNSPGILSTGDLTLAGTASTLVMEISGTSSGLYDQVNVTGAVSLNGTIQLSLLSFTPTLSQIFFPILNDNSDAITGTFVGLAQGSTFSAGGFIWQVSYTGDSTGNTFTGGNDLALQVVPEPQTWALIAAAGIFLLVVRRRRTTLAA
ncbi:hypothetical protein BH09VER1_BH09VER1_31160 [soil metagenome]